MSSISRRQFLLTAGASALATPLLPSCRAENSAPVPSVQSGASGLETTQANLGFLPVVDCAPLVIAQEKGFFAQQGMTGVQIMKQASWAALRDNVEIGSGGGGIDGGHFQSPIPELISEGIGTKGNKKVPMYLLARLNTHGVGISIAKKYQDLGVTKDSSPLKPIFSQAKAENRLIKCAITFPRSSIDLWLHYWLAAGGIDPTTEADIVVIPPSQVVTSMQNGTMDIFCATDPWNARLVEQDIGFTALTTGELWKNHPEKAFALRSDWVDKHPKATIALLKAILEAQRWCDQPTNQGELATILAKQAYVNAPVTSISDRLKGIFNYGDGRNLNDASLALKCWSNSGVNISYPYKSHTNWFLTENIRWGKIPADTDVQRIVNGTNREDLWKEAAQSIGIPTTEIPQTTSRGIETFFDGIKFDPANPNAYLQSMKIKKV
jgi:nitrate/nitrite transport system substrate-binding protein